jgi:plasmanylethanolamine desaturase
MNASSKRTRQRRIEVAGIAAWIGFCAWACSRLAIHHQEIGGWLLVAGIAALIATDFLSGLVHWAADTYGDSSTPILGKTFIQPFREHHEDQFAITRHDFVETNGNNCIISLPLLMTACGMPVEADCHVSLLGAPFLFFTAIYGLATNQIHKWAHQNRAPLPVRILQTLRLVLPPAHHAGHHSRPFTDNYCITNGWMNAPLNAIGFFTGAEWLIARVSGIKARAHDHHIIQKVEPLRAEKEVSQVA